MRILVVSDLHACHLDQKAWEVVLGVASSRPWTHLVFNGDTCDFAQLGKFDKRISAYQREFADDITLDEEILFVKTAILKRARKAVGPKTKILFRLGNHSTRWLSTMESNPRVLAELYKAARKHGSFHLEDVLSLDSMGIRISYNERDVIGGFTFTHGHKTNKTCIRDYLHAYGSGTSGHRHTMDVFRKYHRGRLETWIESGCLCKLRKIPYLPFGNEPEWINGFVSVAVENGFPHPEGHVINDNYECRFDGELFTA